MNQHSHLKSHKGQVLGYVLVVALMLSIGLAAMINYFPQLTRQRALTQKTLNNQIFIDGSLEFMKVAIREQWRLLPVGARNTEPYTDLATFAADNDLALERLLLNERQVLDPDTGLNVRLNAEGVVTPLDSTALISGLTTEAKCENAFLDSPNKANGPGEPYRFNIYPQNLATNHPMYPIVGELGDEFIGVGYIICRVTNLNYPQGGRGAIFLKIRAQLLSGSNQNPVYSDEFGETVVGYFPRELNSFALIVARDIRLDKVNPNDTTGASDGDFVVPLLNNQNVIRNRVTANPPLPAGLNFLSPVFANRDVVLFNGGVDGNDPKYNATAFSERLTLGNGSLKFGSGGVNPVEAPDVFVGGEEGLLTHFQKRFAGFANGVERQGVSDAGLNALFGLDTALPPAALPARCAQQAAVLNDLSATGGSELMIREVDFPTTSPARTLEYRLGYSELNFFSGQGKNGNVARIVETSSSTRFTFDSFPTVQSSDPPIMNVGVYFAQPTENPSSFGEMNNKLAALPASGRPKKFHVEANLAKTDKLSIVLDEADISDLDNDITDAQNAKASAAAQIPGIQSTIASLTAELQTLIDRRDDIVNNLLPAKIAEINSTTSPPQQLFDERDDLISERNKLNGNGNGSINKKQNQLNNAQDDLNDLNGNGNGSLAWHDQQIANAIATKNNAVAINLKFKMEVEILPLLISGNEQNDQVRVLIKLENEEGLLKLSKLRPMIYFEGFEVGTNGNSGNGPTYVPGDPNTVARANGSIRNHLSTFDGSDLGNPALGNYLDSNIVRINLRSAGGSLFSFPNGQDSISSSDFRAVNPYINPDTSATIPPDNNDNSDLVTQCSAPPAFPDFNLSFTADAGVVWNFRPAAQSNMIFDGTNSNFNPVDPATFQWPVYSVVDTCTIAADAVLVTGFYTCRNLVIEARTQPLRIIGTFIVGNTNIDPSAVIQGITWSTIYHPDGTRILRETGQLGPGRNCAQLADPNFVIGLPIWHPEPALMQLGTLYSCGPISLRGSYPSPFTWTELDPVCGPLGNGFSCNYRDRRFKLVTQSNRNTL